ncbi:MAG: hypothetical protein IPK95_10965 [Cellvibrionales bacterium]|nr:hypothetical protein [Cellvibrionales bacterium]
MICKTTAQDIASKITALANDCMPTKTAFILLAGGEITANCFHIIA